METKTETREYYRYDEIREWPMVYGRSVCPDDPRYHVCVRSKANIHPSVLLGSGAAVGAGATVEDGATIESDAVIGSGAVVEA